MKVEVQARERIKRFSADFAGIGPRGTTLNFKCTFNEYRAAMEIRDRGRR